MLFSNDTFCVNECGIVTAMSTHAILLIPLYYIPMALLLVVVAQKFRKKLKLHYKARLALFSKHVYILFLKQPF